MASEASIDVGFLLVDRSIHHLRLMVHGFVLLVAQDSVLAGRVTVTCAEAVECLTRKLAMKACNVRLRLERDRTRVEVSIEADDATLRGIEKVLDAINRESPLSAYTQALANAALPDGDTMLGLTRIRYEGRMSLQSRRQGRQLTLLADTMEAAESAR